MQFQTLLPRRHSFPFSPVLKYHRSPPPPPHVPYKPSSREEGASNSTSSTTRVADINENPFAYFITPPSPPALPSPTAEQLQTPLLQDGPASGRLGEASSSTFGSVSPPTPFLSSSPWSCPDSDSDLDDLYDDEDLALYEEDEEDEEEEDLTAGIEMAPFVRNVHGKSRFFPSAPSGLSPAPRRDNQGNNAIDNLHDSGSGEKRTKAREGPRAKASAGSDSASHPSHTYTDFILFDSSSSSPSSPLPVQPSAPRPPPTNSVDAPTQSAHTQQTPPLPHHRKIVSRAPRRWRRSWAAPDWRLGVILESEDESES